MWFEVPHVWYTITAKAQLHFERSTMEFEVEDAVSTLTLMGDRQLGNIHRVRDHAEFHFQEGAPWILLALLLNVVWNLNPSAMIPYPFASMLEKMSCILC